MMQKYWNSIPNQGEIERGMFIVFPLRYDDRKSLNDFVVHDAESLDFVSSDFVELLAKKCSPSGNFVKRFRINGDIKLLNWDESIKITNYQLFVFSKGVAFLSVFLQYLNKDVDKMYQLIYPGYTSETQDVKNVQAKLLDDISTTVLSKIKPQIQWFIRDKKVQPYILKEAYRLNVAFVPKRFKETDIAKKIAYNEHRIIDISREFEDMSELDVAYTTGARDVDSEDYGWGCCITSQEISYVYARRGSGTLIDRAEEDLLLTLLAMYQKYVCINVNEAIHQRYATNNSRKRKSVQELKRDAMEFIAYGTLVPSQISRWNNVCETFRNLIKMNGIDETISEIENKIHLLNEEQDRIDTKRENGIAMIIAVFGLVSIVGAVLQIVDYVSSGRKEILISFAISVFGVCVFALAIGGMLIWRRHKRGDV